jgi:hypothetical protein
MHIISPKSWLKSFSYLGDPGTTLGRCSCEFTGFYFVRSWIVCVCLADSPWLADISRPLVNHSADCLDRTAIFCWRLLWDCGQSAPVFWTVRPHPGGQSAAARRTVQPVCRNLPSLFGSFAYSLVLPHVFQGIISMT